MYVYICPKPIRCPKSEAAITSGENRVSSENVTIYYGISKRSISAARENMRRIEDLLYLKYVEHVRNALLRIGEDIDDPNVIVDLDDTMNTTTRANRRRIESQLVSENRVSSENVNKYGIKRSTERKNNRANISAARENMRRIEDLHSKKIKKWTDEEST